MITPLPPEREEWVERTFSSLSPDRRLAQLLIPKIDHGATAEALRDLMKQIPFGGVFVWGATAEQHRERIGLLQDAAPVPIVVAADLECGAGHVVHGTAAFPDMLALAAADDEQLAYTMGKAAAIEGRAVGIHWTFAPVVDVNLNPDNPIANTRSLGDDPERIIRLSRAIIRGMQEHGLAACAKHFPGDGIDDVDQHISTSVNSLSIEQWKAVSGRTFAAAYAAGVYSTMIGHIALPAWDSEKDKRGALRPATLSRRIVTDLLRREMGFDGVAVTDDMNMGGAAGYANRRDRTVGCILAGCDMLLFPNLPQEYDVLLAALRSGELPQARVDEACLRVLEFKARLNLHSGNAFGHEATADERKAFEQAGRQVAERAICCARNVNGLLPVRALRKGAHVLTVTLTNDQIELQTVDSELGARGFKVEHLVNPHGGQIDARIEEFRPEAVFVNFTFRANWAIGSPRSIGPHNRMFMNGFYTDHPCAVFTSFGSPYHLRQYGTLANLVNVHSATTESQRAAVAAWLGEIPMPAKSPVGKLERTF